MPLLGGERPLWLGYGQFCCSLWSDCVESRAPKCRRQHVGHSLPHFTGEFCLRASGIESERLSGTGPGFVQALLAHRREKVCRARSQDTHPRRAARRSKSHQGYGCRRRGSRAEASSRHDRPHRMAAALGAPARSKPPAARRIAPILHLAVTTSIHFNPKRMLMHRTVPMLGQREIASTADSLAVPLSDRQ